MISLIKTINFKKSPSIDTQMQSKCFRWVELILLLRLFAKGHTYFSSKILILKINVLCLGRLFLNYDF